MTGTFERAELLSVARRAIAAAVTGTPKPDLSAFEGAPARHAGAFVTLHLHGALRGCIGHIEPDRPLVDVVASCAVSAAQADPRFPPVTASEVDPLEIEISVLSGFEPIASTADIEVGRHGLLVESGWRRGLLLPQVAPEWGWARRPWARCWRAICRWRPPVEQRRDRTLRRRRSG